MSQEMIVIHCHFAPFGTSICHLQNGCQNIDLRSDAHVQCIHNVCSPIEEVYDTNLFRHMIGVDNLLIFFVDAIACHSTVS